MIATISKSKTRTILLVRMNIRAKYTVLATTTNLILCKEKESQILHQNLPCDEENNRKLQ